jgi:hypothetical protein
LETAGDLEKPLAKASRYKAGTGKKPFAVLDLGYLFGVGMAYLHAKQKGGDRLEVLSKARVSASPLGSAPHRHLSG